MKRSLGIFAIGLAVGVAIGFALFGRGQKASNVAGAAHIEKSEPETSLLPSTSPIDVGNAKILLGKIDTVPFQELYGLLSEQTPAEIEQLAQQLDDFPPGKATTAKIAAFFKAWSHLDPTAAFNAGSKLKAEEARNTAITATLSGADASAAGSLAQALVDLPEGVLSTMNKAGLLGMIIGKWSGVDAPAAAKFFDQHPEKGIRYTMAGFSIARDWASNDPAAAMAWAGQHLEGSTGMSALSGALSGWWQKDHAAAEAYALAHVNDPDAMHLMSALVSEMVRDNPQRAAAWVAQIPTGEIRNSNETMLAAMWAMNDPRAASEWASSLPDEQSAMALGSAMSFWAKTDPQAASQWLEQLSGTTRDNAIGAFSAGIVSRDPATALKWVESIGDASVRNRTLRRVVARWQARDPVAARNWIHNSSLSEADKARLLGSPPSG